MHIQEPHQEQRECDEKHQAAHEKDDQDIDVVEIFKAHNSHSMPTHGEQSSTENTET